MNIVNTAFSKLVGCLTSIVAETVFVITGLFPTSSAAQAPDSVITYLQHTFQTNTPHAAPRWADKVELRPKNIETIRRQLWALWLKAAAQTDEPHLPTGTKLADGATGYLTIPDSLEPYAIMPFYWGTKGNPDLQLNNVFLPTFIHLHGSGPKTMEWETSLKWTKVFADAPSQYFIPQIPQEGKYYRWWQRSKQWAWRWLWRQLMQQPGTDADRIYLLGISEGGYGSQRLASFYADYLAAAGPMAGGEPLINAPAENLQHIGFSLLTGALDNGFCRNRYTAIIGHVLDSLAIGTPGDYAHRVTLIPGQGHGIDYRLMTPWLLQFRRQSHPRHFVWEDFEMDGLHRNGFYNLRVLERPDDSLRTRFDVRMSGESIVDITISRVQYVPVETDSTWHLTIRWWKRLLPPIGHGRLILYLDEQMGLDLSRPMTVRINGHVAYKGRPHLSYRQMLESLTTFADPRRIYPIGITLNY